MLQILKDQSTKQQQNVLNVNPSEYILTYGSSSTTVNYYVCRSYKIRDGFRVISCFCFRKGKFIVIIDQGQF